MKYIYTKNRLVIKSTSIKELMESLLNKPKNDPNF